MFRILQTFASVAICCAGWASPALASDKAVFGYVENAFFGDLRLEMKAKLDSGAASSSVFARDVELYTKGKKDDWVRFRLVGKNGRSVRYDQNVTRFALIKKKGGQGTIRRPVVNLPICVGGVAGDAEVNLADREDFNYEALIGREFLAGRILIDSGASFLAEGDCSIKQDKE